jgi:hypothetical protein
MRKSYSLAIAIPAILAASAAFAVGSQAPSALTSQGGPKTSYNGFTDQELNTAKIHADHAASGKDLADIKEHLHHVINCLVGPNGPGFDSNVEDPCARMGKGALNDVTANSDEHRLLTQAFNEATNALTLNDVADAKSTAKKVLNDIENAETDTQQ